MSLEKLLEEAKFFDGKVETEYIRAGEQFISMGRKGLIFFRALNPEERQLVERYVIEQWIKDNAVVSVSYDPPRKFLG